MVCCAGHRVIIQISGPIRQKNIDATQCGSDSGVRPAVLLDPIAVLPSGLKSAMKPRAFGAKADANADADADADAKVSGSARRQVDELPGSGTTAQPLIRQLASACCCSW